MGTKYIVKSEHGWEVKNAKAERASKVLPTQALAIDHAAGIKGTRTIMVQNEKGKFRKITGWDQSHAAHDIVHPENNFAKPKHKKYSKWFYVIPYVLLVAVGTIVGMAIGGLF